MSAPPTPRYLTSDTDLPTLIEAFNQFQLESIQSTTSRLTRADNFASSSREGIRFRSPASGDAVVQLKTNLSRPAKHVVCSWLARADAKAVGGPWSCVAFNISSTEIEVTFTGLTASIGYVANFLIE